VHGGQVKIHFFARNFLTNKRPRVYFGPLLGGARAHILLFSFASNFRVTRQIVDFRRNFGFFSAEVGRGTVAKILSLMGLGGPHIAHAKIWTPPLRFLRNLAKTFWGWVARGGGGWGLNLRGRPELGRGN